MAKKKVQSKPKSGPARELLNLSVREFIDEYIYRIDLDADYQREKIWSKEDQERLLDSIIKNIDIPKIYLAKVRGSENFDFECIDGKQRMTTLLEYMKPEPGGGQLAIRVAGEKYTYKHLKKDLPTLAEKLDKFELTFVIYQDLGDEEFVREIFRRLQLGVRLNSGELLKTYTGGMRDFVYKEMGSGAPFISRTSLSEKRFSRQLTLAQICINSFARQDTGEFTRARYEDLADFFKEQEDISGADANLSRIRKVLVLMDKQFTDSAAKISSRAVAVSAYLFAEELVIDKKVAKVGDFAKFYIALLDEVAINLNLISKYEKPKNALVLEDFQKYIAQASVEPYAIRRRHEFLQKAFSHFTSSKTKGKLPN